MKILKVLLGILVVLALVVLLIAPIGPLPGVFIGGSATPAPEQWPDTGAVHEIELKVPGGIPRVVVIWVIQHAGKLHVVGSADSGWVKVIGAASPVEMRLGDNTYALNATELNDDWEGVLTAYVDKYRPDYPEIVDGFPPIEEAAGAIKVFRLNR